MSKIFILPVYAMFWLFKVWGKFISLSEQVAVESHLFFWFYYKCTTQGVAPHLHSLLHNNADIIFHWGLSLDGECVYLSKVVLHRGLVGVTVRKTEDEVVLIQSRVESFFCYNIVSSWVSHMGSL